MRIGIISDVHSNLDALEAVLAAMQPVDQVWCLGDLDESDNREPGSIHQEIFVRPF